MRALVRTCILFAFVAAAPLAAASGALDGKSFSGEIGDAGKPVGETVVFTFVDGTFRSSVCDKYGFERGPYTTTKEGEAVRFEARTVSAEYGVNHWLGTVKDGAIEGRLTWQPKSSFFRPNPPPVERWFKAKLE